MRFSCTKEDLVRSVGVVRPAVSGNHIVPVLSNILLRSADEYMQLQASNLRVGIATLMHAKIFDGGEITIPGDVFGKIVTHLPAEEVVISTTENHRITIEYSNGACRLIGLGVDEFPYMPTAAESLMTVEGDMLSNMLTNTASVHCQRRN